MRLLECSKTSWESPTTNIVPIFRPSLPSRAISTARMTVCFRVSGLIPLFSLQIPQKISSGVRIILRFAIGRLLLSFGVRHVVNHRDDN